MLFITLFFITVEISSHSLVYTVYDVTVCYNTPVKKARIYKRCYDYKFFNYFTDSFFRSQRPVVHV